MNIIVSKKVQLPSTIEDLTRFVLIGREKLVSVRAQIRAIDKLNLAQNVMDQKKEEATGLAEALLDAETKIGDLLGDLPCPAGRKGIEKGGVEKILPPGISHKQSHFFQQLAQNKDIVEKVKAEARENDDLATRTEVMRQIKETKKGQDAEKRAEKRSENSAAVTVDRENDLKKVCGIKQFDIMDITPQMMSKIDAVITDPPYPREYLKLYEQLARICVDVPMVAVMCGQSWLPEIYAIMSNHHLKYRWTLAYMTPGQATPIQDRDRGLAGSHWKPILLFGGPGRCLGDDVFTSKSPDKDHDEWGQSLSGMTDLVTRLTEPGQMVCDPFCGGGATAVACVKNNRRFVGFDINPDDVKISWDRCKIAADEMRKK